MGCYQFAVSAAASGRVAVFVLRDPFREPVPSWGRVTGQQHAASDADGLPQRGQVTRHLRAVAHQPCAPANCVVVTPRLRGERRWLVCFTCALSIRSDAKHCFMFRSPLCLFSSAASLSFAHSSTGFSVFLIDLYYSLHIKEMSLSIYIASAFPRSPSSCNFFVPFSLCWTSYIVKCQIHLFSLRFLSFWD